MPNGTSVVMRCWTDSEAPTYVDKRYTSKRWFWVTEINHDPQYSGFVYSDLVPVPSQVPTPKCPDNDTGYSTGPNSIFSQYPTNPSDSTLTVANEGTHLNVTVLDEFPTGSATVYCHAGTGYPTGGNVTNLGQFNIALTVRDNPDWTQSWVDEWSEPLCASSGTIWIGIYAADGLSFYSNVIDLGSAPPPPDPGYLIGVNNEQLAGSQLAGEPMNLVSGGIENAGGSPLPIGRVTFTMIDPSGNYHDALCQDPSAGLLQNFSLSPGQSVVCRASIIPDRSGNWPFEIDWQEPDGTWHRGELYNPGTVTIALGRQFVVTSPLTVTAPQGIHTGLPLQFAFTIQNASPEPGDLQSMIIQEGPGGELQYDCNDGSTQTLAPGASTRCVIVWSVDDPGTYTFAPEWFDSVALENTSRAGQATLHVTAPKLLTHITQLGLGNFTGCAKATRVVCWGLDDTGTNGSGQKPSNSSNGQGFEPVPVLVNPKTSSAWSAQVKQLSSSDGSLVTCALMRNTTVQCWGDAMFGELGRGKTVDRAALPAAVAAVHGTGPLKGVRQLSVGPTKSCALLSGGHVVCWGATWNQTRGNYDIANRPAYVPAARGAGLLNGVRNVQAGAATACAVMYDATVDCWGSGQFGSLGNGHTKDSRRPVPVLGVGRAARLKYVSQLASANIYETCARLTNGRGVCWGTGRGNQRGDGRNTDSARPTYILDAAEKHPLASIRSVAVDAEHGCVIMADTTARCWGSDVAGLDGRYNWTTQMSVVDGPSGAPLKGVVSVALGYRMSCFILKSGTAWCVGQTSFGQTGSGWGGAIGEDVSITTRPVLAGQAPG